MKQLTEADKAMIHALAEQVLTDRITKTMTLSAPNDKGRQHHTRIAPPTQAEQMWYKLQEEHRA